MTFGAGGLTGWSRRLDSKKQIASIVEHRGAEGRQNQGAVHAVNESPASTNDSRNNSQQDFIDDPGYKHARAICIAAMIETLSAPAVCFASATARGTPSNTNVGAWQADFPVPILRKPVAASAVPRRFSGARVSVCRSGVSGS